MADSDDKGGKGKGKPPHKGKPKECDPETMSPADYKACVNARNATCKDGIGTGCPPDPDAAPVAPASVATRPSWASLPSSVASGEAQETAAELNVYAYAGGGAAVGYLAAKVLGINPLVGVALGGGAGWLYGSGR